MKLVELQEAKYHRETSMTKILAWLKQHPDSVYDSDNVVTNTYDELHDTVWNVAHELDLDLEEYDDEELGEEIGKIHDYFYDKSRLQEASYSTNYYAVAWTNEYDSKGFVGPTQSRIGEYEVFNETNEMFKPDNDDYVDIDFGYIIVALSLEEAKKENVMFSEGGEFHVTDQTRTKFGKLIGTSPDIKYYP